MRGSTPGHSQPVADFMTHGIQDTVTIYPDYGVPQLHDFARVNGCSSSDPNLSASRFEQALPEPASTNAACVEFDGCQGGSAGYAVQACLFRGDHTPSPGGLTPSWVPAETWSFVSRF